MTVVPPLESLDAIIFDLGGVLLDLDPAASVSALSRLYGSDASVLYTQQKQVGLFDRFERGEISPTDFRSGLGALLGAVQQPSDLAIDEAWNAMILDFPAAKLDLLVRLRGLTRTFLLSNTNAIHLERFLADYAERHSSSHGPWEGLFEQTHYSHVLGLRKPEPRVYERVLAIHGLEAGRCLFIDDNAHNIEAARGLGLQTLLLPTNAPLDPYFAAF
ncbi:MAG TPA: HAD family phosphatase [Polyangiaceae bacterium]|nr:HAD family phosphatase [Polyangiaceae bacterium]